MSSWPAGASSKAGSICSWTMSVAVSPGPSRRSAKETTMTIRKIASIGHPVLRTRARELEVAELESPEIQRLIDDLVDTMRDANGAGLAANQIHEAVRVCVIEVNQNP